MSKIKNFLNNISETNDFYKNIIQEHRISNPTDITQYPILTRQQLQESRYNMFSDGYKSKYFNQQLRRQSSSGSSGIPVNVYWDHVDYYKSTISIWRKRREYYGIHPFDKYVKFTFPAFNTDSETDTVYITNETENILSINISNLHTKENFKELIKIIDDFSPVWLYIQPFIMQKLINYYSLFGITVPNSIKYIESVGELLPSKLKTDAETFFKVPIANMYGSEEMNVIAYECPHHHMHILEDNVFVECKNVNCITNDGEGEAIITSLNNYAMPLIRYNQGDIIVIKTPGAPCECGNDSPIIKIIKGRSHDCIVENAIEINSYLMCEIIAEVNNQFNDAITSYRFEYIKSEKKLLCYLSFSLKYILWREKVVEEFKTILELRIPNKAMVVYEILPLNSEDKINKKFRPLEIKE